jgi:hypothetical protein
MCNSPLLNPITLLLLLLLLLLQGLNKNDMITLVTGSHSVGGFRTFSSADLTDCPYVPFDCTAAGKQANVSNTVNVTPNGARAAVAMRSASSLGLKYDLYQ